MRAHTEIQQIQAQAHTRKRTQKIHIHQTKCTHTQSDSHTSKSARTHTIKKNVHA